MDMDVDVDLMGKWLGLWCYICCEVVELEDGFGGPSCIPTVDMHYVIWSSVGGWM